MRWVGKPTVHAPAGPRRGLGPDAPAPSLATLFNGALAHWRGYSALAAASTSSAWPETFTFSQMRAILPSGPIR
jgi:hypothetical protein